MSDTMEPEVVEQLEVKEERSLVRVMASRYELNEANFITAVKKACFTGKAENPTNEELMIFLGVAERYHLDPFVKEITAFRTKSGGIANVVTIDGWIKLIQRHPALDGFEFKDDYGGGDDAGRSALISITCKIFRKDQSHPTTCTEYMIECKKKGDAYTPWNQWPRRMLRHKSLIQCARYAFGFSGIIDPEEALRMAPVTQASGDGGEASKTATEAGSADDLTSPRLADDQTNPHERERGGGEQDPSAAQQTAREPDTATQSKNETEATDEKSETKTERTNRVRLKIGDSAGDPEAIIGIKDWILHHPSEFTEHQYKKLMAQIETVEKNAKIEATEGPGSTAPSYEDQIAAATVQTLGDILSQIMADGTGGHLADDFPRYKRLIELTSQRKIELMQ